MRKAFLLLCVIGLLLACQTVWADQIISGSGGWQNYYIVNQNGYPFWDNSSWDGNYKNIGYYLTQTGDYSGWAPYEHPGAIPYYGTSTGEAVSSFYFKKDSAYSNAALKLEVAGYRDWNSFGWYEWNTTETSYTTHQIFSGIDSAPDAEIFTPTAEYGFYMVNKVGETFLTQAGAFQTEDSTFQHFAVFLQFPNTYWIGIEDLLGGGDKDFNDMVIKVTPFSATVPEPATMLLLGCGLIVITGFGRKKLFK